MIPHEKEMVERLQDEPFALIGINSDGDRESLQKILKDNGIAWRQAVDGSTNGPLATRWNVHGWPTIYILDHKGVIRFRDLRDEAMERAVMELLAEIRP
ncbi:MAG: TlpA family protein disulfide reductase [Planctomycetota bacterium]|nr:MAG: TlpA family protein disulfide reductase [Planctomycetota bacterium]